MSNKRVLLRPENQTQVSFHLRSLNKFYIFVLGHELCSEIQKSVCINELWKVHNSSKDSEILNLLSDSFKVVQTWNSACKSLTETYWPNYALHAWNGKPYAPPFCLNFQNRIKEVGIF